MGAPTIARKGPFAIEVEAGKSYWWCACGKSRTQPFCDGSHSGSEFAPLEYKADENKTIWFCGCKHTASAPMCDGSHSKI